MYTIIHLQECEDSSLQGLKYHKLSEENAPEILILKS